MLTVPVGQDFGKVRDRGELGCGLSLIHGAGGLNGAIQRLVGSSWGGGWDAGRMFTHGYDVQLEEQTPGCPSVGLTGGHSAWLSFLTAWGSQGRAEHACHHTQRNCTVVLS